MTPSHSLCLKRAIVVLVLLGTATITVFGQETAARPDRGVMPNGSYAVSDIENISMSNGNVNLKIPLASLPPMAGGKLSWTINAHYNSKLWNMNRVELLGERYDLSEVPYVVDTPQLSEQGGWRISGQYELEIRDARSDFDYQLPPVADEPDYSLMNNFNWYRVVLRMPDGAEHELRPMDYSPYNGGRSFLFGYFKETPYTHGAMRYYSFDGSYLYATVTSDNNWTVYLPDGTKVVQTTDGIQRIQDTNGNKIKIWTDTLGTHYQDEQTGREIRYVIEPSGKGRVYYKKVTGAADAYVEIIFDETTVLGQLYKVNDWEPGQVPAQPGWHYEELYTVIPVIRDIVLPETQSGVTRKFSFEYSSDDTEIASFPTRTASKGWGYLSHIDMPSGAKIDYTYHLEGIHNLFNPNDLARMSITEKKLDHDGTFDTWSYSINDNLATVTNPDGSTITENKFGRPGYIGSGYGGAGVPYRTTRPFMKTERHWTHMVFSGAQTASPNGDVDFNSVIDYEYTTLTDAAGNNLKMSAKAFQYDYNGNLTQTTEYDWFDPALVSRDAQGVPTGVPGSATVLRTTTNSYYNPATTSSSGNVYAKRSISTATPLILNALQETITWPARAQFSYDGYPYGTAPNFGNLTSKKVWADLDSKWITTSMTYGTYGNIATSTDARGNVTTFGYLNPALGLPTSVTVDPQNGTGAQITTTEYDYYTGLVTSQTDPNNQLSTIDYTNQLLPGGAKDPFGRPGVTLGPLVNVNGVNQRQKITTTYYDSTRQVITASDLFAEDDRLLKTRTTADELGRVVLVEQTEDGTNYTISSRTAYDTANRMTFSSGPMRSGAASTDSWTRVTNDIAGRAVEVATFAGATQPGTAAANQIAGWTGSVTTAYEANFTTVIDQAGKQRRSVADGLGRLIRVDEPDKDSGQLGSTAQPIQPTCYQYNVLGNLTKVIQGSQLDPVTGICALSGSQQRTFTYDSLSRLRTAQNPESGTLTYTYDDNGNLLTKLDARSITSNYVYDSLNRVTSRTYSDGTPAVTYVYDTLAQNGKGRLTSVSSSVSTYSYSGYDAMGRVTGASQTIGAQTYAITNVAFDLAGHLKTMTYPSGRTVTNTYDNAGRLSSFSGNLGDGGSPRTYATDFQYTALNGVQQEKFGTTTPIYHKQRFNSRGQLWDMRASTVSFATDPANGDRGAIVNHYSNTFTQGGSGSDNNGNLLRQENYIPGSSFFQDNFAYDSLNRLSSIAEKLNGTGTDSFKQVYVYDRWGNRTIDQVNTANAPKPNFGVNTSNNRLTAPAGYTMSYDAAGNLTNDTFTGEGVRTYDAENRMKQAWSNNQWQTYSYDGDGRRVKRIVNGVETWQVYGLGGELIAEYAANGAPANPQKEYGYRNGELLVTAETSSGGGGGSAQPVTWTNTVGVSVSGNSLTDTTAAGWGDSGASSTQTIASGDGYVEFTTTGSQY
ncbi:MAG TPA: hypothetical protein VJV21_03410, partial [Pyrinomonadaceae bacterium]|nr:hypothetical protein [Pyrinomonadaceae bacterium]